MSIILKAYNRTSRIQFHKFEAKSMNVEKDIIKENEISLEKENNHHKFFSLPECFNYARFYALLLLACRMRTVRNTDERAKCENTDGNQTVN